MNGMQEFKRGQIVSWDYGKGRYRVTEKLAPPWPNEFPRYVIRHVETGVEHRGVRDKDLNAEGSPYFSAFL